MSTARWNGIDSKYEEKKREKEEKKKKKKEPSIQLQKRTDLLYSNKDGKKRGKEKK